MATALLSAGPLSGFLYLLEHLADDAWSQTLLPMLVADGSAGNLALTCSCMRTHIHGNMQQIRFQAQHMQQVSPFELEKWTVTIPQHFPKCDSVLLSLPDDTSYMGVSALLPALTRLPKLCKLHVNISIVNPLGLEMLLSTMRRQLPDLTCLTLASTAHWWAAAASWQQLGAMTQLTRLVVKFPPHKDSTVPALLPAGAAAQAFQWHDIACLGGLTQLQHLMLVGHNACGHQSHSGVSFLSKLTGLTSLELVMPVVSGLSAVRSCTKLRRLWVRPVPSATAGGFDTFGAQDCEAVSHLTGLTSLGLLWPLQDRAVPALYSSLQHLPQLNSVGAAEWTLEVLPVFASQLPRLEAVHGAWRASRRQLDIADPGGDPTAGDVKLSSDSSCPQVLHLCEAAGWVPFQAFPNLTGLCQIGSIQPSALASVSRHCTKLQELNINQTHPHALSWCSLPPEISCAERAAALFGLARLPYALEACVWSVYDDAEMMALVHVARYAPNLYVIVPLGSAVTTGGLMQLGGARMDVLSLDLQGISFTPAAARMLLGCLHNQVILKLIVATVEQMRVFEAAGAWLDQVGLNRPARISVQRGYV